MNIGEKIRKVREFKDFSQQNLVDKLNISQKQLSRIENGHVSPTFELMDRICEALEIKLHELMQLNENMIFNSYTQHQRGGEFVAYNNTDIKQIENLYKQLLAEKEKVIVLLENKIELLLKSHKNVRTR